jgi:hypothetical protein
MFPNINIYLATVRSSRSPPPPPAGVGDRRPTRGTCTHPLAGSLCSVVAKKKRFFIPLFSTELKRGIYMSVNKLHHFCHYLFHFKTVRYFCPIMYMAVGITTHVNIIFFQNKPMAVATWDSLSLSLSLYIYIYIYDSHVHGMENYKFVTAKQANSFYNYKNTKEELLKASSPIWFNKICIIQHLTPKYINIQIKGNSRQNQNTKKKTKGVGKFRLRQELKFLYIKQQKLNEKLYHTHLECANQWTGIWSDLQDSVNRKLN